MGVSLLRLAIGLSWFLTGIQAEESVDVHRMQSAARPAPPWLTETVDQGDNDPRLKGFITPKGLKLEIVADAPTVINPVGMTFDDEGTAYVLEWVTADSNWNEVPVTFTYKDGSKRNVATMKKNKRDIVKILTSTKKNGIYDKADELLTDELPSSILVHNEWVPPALMRKGFFRKWIYLSSRGTVRRFTQSKANGPYDKMETIAQGFCGFHHHQVSGMTIGNDGRLYITSGDDDNFVEGSDGSRATVLRSGAIFRSLLDGSQMETFSLGFRNPYRNVAFDENYQMFHLDNDNEDGSKFTGCRFMHVTEGADFGWRLRQGARCCAPDTTRGAAFGELPGKMTPMLKTGRGAPAGLLIYNDTFLPKPFQGLMYYPDVFRRNIRAYKVAPEGASFKVTEEFELIKSDDPLFRPNQAVVGPDGAMYIVDWRTDSGGAGRLFGDGVHGRIYRLSAADTKKYPLRGMDSWLKLRDRSDDELAEALAGGNQTDRERAQRELVRRGAVDALLAILKKGKTALARMAAIGGLHSLWNKTVEKEVLAILDDPSADLRRLAAEALALKAASKDAKVGEALEKHLSDPHPSTRRAVVMALGRVRHANAAEALSKAFTNLTEAERKDRYLVDGFVRSFEQIGKAGVAKLIQLAASPTPADRDFGIDAITTLRTREGLDVVSFALKLGKITTPQKVALIRAHGNFLLEPAADLLTPMLDYFKNHQNVPAEVTLAAVETLSGTGALQGKEAATFLIKSMEQGNPSLSLASVRAIQTARLGDAGSGLVSRLKQEKSIELKIAILRALQSLGERQVVALLPDLVASENNELALEAFRTLVAFDATKAYDLAPKLLKSKEVALQREAITSLGMDAVGAKLLAQEFLDKKIPRELLREVMGAIKKNVPKDAKLAELLEKVVKSGLILSVDPKDVEQIQTLVKKQGNPERGRVVYLNDKLVSCTKCHRLEGLGGQIGPDLTRIWETQSVHKVLESILEPSKEVNKEYRTVKILTTSDRVISGIKVAETEKELILRDIQGTEHHIAIGDIAERKTEDTSLMPSDTISLLDYDQFIDLVAFLKDRSAQESIRTRALEMWVVGPFGDTEATSYGPEKNATPLATYESDKAKGKVAWKKVRTESNGYLNLRTEFKSDFMSAYALTYVYSPKDDKEGSATTMLVGSDDSVKVWINGELKHSKSEFRGATPDSDPVTVKLKKGWNTVLVRVINGTLEHGLFLRFQGADGLIVSPVPAGK